MSYRSGWAMMCVAAVLCGCSQPTSNNAPTEPSAAPEGAAVVTSSPPATAPAEPIAPSPEPGTGPAHPVRSFAPGDNPLSSANLPSRAAPTGQSQPTAPTERLQAQVGVGKRGRSLDDVRGVTEIIVQPARSLFATKERVVFEIQIPKAMQLYKATNGQAPASHEEFMEQIISANRIRLPELPSGQRYVYDPRTELLMVERPKR